MRGLASLTPIRAKLSPSPRQAGAIRRRLLRWYEENARALPWRGRRRTSYHVWVAEVMLQQTRIAVAIPAYRRFLLAFPTMPRLARATEEQVLSLWSGLGYYSRARALHRAARTLLARGARSFPREMNEALALPGVGPYTAAAVLSIAYDLPYATVDGNVNRVLSRLRRLPPPDSRGEPQRSLANGLLDRARPGDWNQALMELGERICLPRTPHCPECPLAVACEAFLGNDVESFPIRGRRREPECLALRMTVVQDRNGHFLLERGAFPYLRHLWLPPLRECGEESRLTGVERGAVRTGRFRHAILHRRFEVRLFRKVIGSREIRLLLDGQGKSDVQRRLFSPGAIENIGRSALLTKALRRL